MLEELEPVDEPYGFAGPVNNRQRKEVGIIEKSGPDLLAIGVGRQRGDRRRQAADGAGDDGVGGEESRMARHQSRPVLDQRVQYRSKPSRPSGVHSKF